MNNDNEANDANDNSDELFVGQPETERQELLRRRREFEQERQMLLQERAQLLLETQQERVENRCIIEQPTIIPVIPMVGFLLVLERD